MQTTKINREDMLELTRRMNLKRNCFSRITGAYFDEEGFVDGTFNTHFLKLKAKEQTSKIEIAKSIPFSNTNINLVEYNFDKEHQKPGSMWQLLMALRDCELKNDALLDVLYDVIGEKYISNKPYAVLMFYGSYDVPLKAADKESLWESEEVYKFMICAICPIVGDYEVEEAECGFMFPAFTDRSSNINGIEVYSKDAKNVSKELVKIIFG